MSAPNAKARIDLLSLIKPPTAQSFQPNISNSPSPPLVAESSSIPKKEAAATDDASGATKPRFTYVNPFFNLESSSPISRFKSSKSTSVSQLAEPTYSEEAVVQTMTEQDKFSQNVADLSFSDSVNATITSNLPSLRNSSSGTATGNLSQSIGYDSVTANAGSPISTPSINLKGHKLPTGSVSLTFPSRAAIDGSFQEDACIPIANFVRPLHEHDRNILAADVNFIAYPVSNGQ